MPEKTLNKRGLSKIRGDMMIVVRNALLAAILAVVTGCSGPKTKPMNELLTAPNEKLPPVSVFYKRPSKKLSQDCTAFDDESALSYCHLNLITKDIFEQKLRESKYFENVLSHVQEVEYTIAVTYARLKHEGAGELGNAVISGLTIGAVPMKESSRVRSEIAVMWRDVPLKFYEYELPLESSVSILQPGSRDAGIVAMQTELTSRFLQDAESDGVFTAPFLNRKLGANDYEKELGYPQQIGEFTFQGQQIYPHPLAGTQLRYRHKTFDFDYIDAFIYPIRETDWSNQSAVLAREMDNFRKEIELAQREGVIESVTLDAAEAISWESGHQIYQGRRISGIVINTNRETYRTFMYLFVKEDKFIKFRATFVKTENEPAIEDSLKQSLTEFIVPKESLFMAKVRQHERENKIQ